MTNRIPVVKLVRERWIRTPTGPLNGARDVVRLFRPLLAFEEVECIWVAALNTQNVPVFVSLVTRGLLNASLVHPREVFRLAVRENAAGLMVAHNHPCGSTTPSPEDREITRMLVAAGRVLGIPVYDHVIIAGDGHFSFAENGSL